MIPANWLYENGIRIDVKDETNPGPLVSYNAAWDHIKGLLDDGYTELTQSGNPLPFKLSSGMVGYDTPARLIKMNRAISARLVLYRKAWQGALGALSGSFMILAGNC